MTAGRGPSGASTPGTPGLPTFAFLRPRYPGEAGHSTLSGA
ncbi:hypothetical protein QFZ66_006264 [Streptomyces sp. B4I13]|nr:hypothetical protein [Streptomyces sp. B4I13]